MSELAWAAGFFDGEGSIVRHTRNRVCLAVGQTDQRPLIRLQKALSYGTIVGPYMTKPGTLSKKPIWYFRVHAKEAIQDCLNKLWPYLSEPKKERALEIY